MVVNGGLDLVELGRQLAGQRVVLHYIAPQDKLMTSRGRFIVDRESRAGRYNHNIRKRKLRLESWHSVYTACARQHVDIMRGRVLTKAIKCATSLERHMAPRGHSFERISARFGASGTAVDVPTYQAHAAPSQRATW